MLSSLKARAGLLLIVLVFLASGGYPFFRDAPYFDVGTIEMIQIRKMLDYGFVERRGIVVQVMETTGRLAHPEKFNYVHHPLLRNWPYAALYHWFGAVGVVLFNVAAGLLECLLIYAALRRHFGFVPSLVPAALCACAPALQFWAVGSTSIIPMVLFWPVAALLVRPRDGQPWRGQGLWLGLTVFLAGQVSWSILATVPTFLLMSAVPGAGWKDTVRRNLSNRLWRAIIVGAALTAVVFLEQAILCSPNLLEPFQYAGRFMRATAPDRQHTIWAHLKEFLGFLLRTVVLVGPALSAGLLLGVSAATRAKGLTLTAVGMIGFGALFLLGMLLLPFFYFNEKWLVAWLLFPAAYLTAYGLSRTKPHAFVWALSLLAVPGFLYVQATAAMPKVSQASEALARYLIQHTRPEDLILTDLKAQAFPFKYWDLYGLERLADRLAIGGVSSLNEVQTFEETYRGQIARTLYLRQSSGHIEDALEQELRAQGKLLDHASLAMPAEKETGDLPLLRPIYRWRHLQGVGASPDEAAHHTNQTVTLDLYLLEPH